MAIDRLGQLRNTMCCVSRRYSLCKILKDFCKFELKQKEMSVSRDRHELAQLIQNGSSHVGWYVVVLERFKFNHFRGVAKNKMELVPRIGKDTPVCESDLSSP